MGGAGLPYIWHSPAQIVARSSKRSLDFATSSSDRLHAILTHALKTRNVVVHSALEEMWDVGSTGRLDRDPGRTAKLRSDHNDPCGPMYVLQKSIIRRVMLSTHSYVLVDLPNTETKNGCAAANWRPVVVRTGEGRGRC